MINPISTRWPFYVSGAVLGILTAAAAWLFGGNVPARAELPCGILAGALLAALFSKEFRVEFLPGEGESVTGRWVVAVVCGLSGGYLAALGMRLSGVGPAGEFILAVVGRPEAWLFLAVALVIAVVVSLLFGGASGGGTGKDCGGGAKVRRSNSSTAGRRRKK